MTAFAVGVVTYNETNEILGETFYAIDGSTAKPSELIIVANGRARCRPSSATLITPHSNLGCAGGWNLLHKLAKPLPIVIVNADCAVAPDTFERMLESVARGAKVVLAYAFGCFLITEDVWQRVGEFDEGFFPVYWEDTDYRRRLALAGVIVEEWDSRPVEIVSTGRARSAAGIVHGKAADNYQGWDEAELAWFHERLAANQARYVAKWGGLVGEETNFSPRIP